MVKPLSLVGKTFGRLVVVSREQNTKHGQTVWEVVCTCGERRLVAGTNLTTGKTRSCGCLVSDVLRVRNAKHGQGSRAKKSRAYSAWKEMKRRCLNPNSKSYKSYGLKGVGIYPDWIDSFESFYAHIGDCPDGWELDRIDNSKGYEPGNVRWASETTQSRNRKYCKLDPEKAQQIRLDPRPSRAVAKDYGVNKTTILRVRNNKGWVDG